MAVLVTEHGTLVGHIPAWATQPKEEAPKAAEPQQDKPKTSRAKAKKATKAE